MIDDRPVQDPEQVALSRVISDIGKPSFYRSLLQFAQALCGFEHLSVFGFSSTLEPRIVMLEGLDDPSVTNLSARSYMGFGYYSADPARARIRELGEGVDAPAVLPLWARDIADAAYRRDIYEKFGLDGRVSLIGCSNEQWRSINFYKHVKKGGLADSDIVAVTKRAQVLFAAETRHLELLGDDHPSQTSVTVPSLDFLQQLLAIVAPDLSRREAEVCARALQGMTGEGTALDLNITDATVATLRRRAYAKLNISNLNELFALCLSAAAEKSRRSGGGT